MCASFSVRMMAVPKNDKYKDYARYAAIRTVSPRFSWVDAMEEKQKTLVAHRDSLDNFKVW
jgi:hypothetical protein